MNTHSLRHITVLSAQKAVITVPTSSQSRVSETSVPETTDWNFCLCCRIYCELQLSFSARNPAQYVQNTPAVSEPFFTTSHNNIPTAHVECTVFDDLEQTVSFYLPQPWLVQSCRCDSLSAEEHHTVSYSNSCCVPLHRTFRDLCLGLQDFKPVFIPRQVRFSRATY